MNAHDHVIGDRCEVKDYFLIKVRRRYMTKQGTIRGYYLYPYWHPHVYKAYHIEFDDGTKDTYLAKNVKVLEKSDPHPLK